jgi:hypothetical protein
MAIAITMTAIMPITKGDQKLLEDVPIGVKVGKLLPLPLLLLLPFPLPLLFPLPFPEELELGPGVAVAVPPPVTTKVALAIIPELS